MYTVIKQIDLYEEHLEPAWEYPDPNDQWLFAETIKEYVGTEFNVLYVYDNGKYEELRGLKEIPPAALEIVRADLNYDKVLDSLVNPWQKFCRAIFK